MSETILCVWSLSDPAADASAGTGDASAVSLPLLDLRHSTRRPLFSRQLEKRLASPGRERKACKCEQLFEDQRLAALSSLCTGQVEAVGV